MRRWSQLLRNMERYFQLAHSFALRLLESLLPAWSLLPAGIKRCSQLVRILALSWCGALLSAGMAHCFQLERSLDAAGMDRRSELVRLLQLEQLVGSVAPFWHPGGPFLLLGSILGYHFGTSNPGLPWNQQDGHKVVRNMIFFHRF